MKQSGKDVIKMVLIMAVVLAACVFFSSKYLHKNITASLDFTYGFRVPGKPGNLDIKKGHYVRFKHEYYGAKEYFIKQVACMPGEMLEVKKSRMFFCDGSYLGTALERSEDGSQLKYFKYNGVIPPDHYFLMGTHPLSWDSRYWGMKEKSELEERVIPIFSRELVDYFTDGQ